MTIVGFDAAISLADSDMLGVRLDLGGNRRGIVSNASTVDLRDSEIG